MKRTRALSPVYLSADERDLVHDALGALHDSLQPVTSAEHTKTTKFARSYTAKRIAAVRALFIDQPKAST